MSASTCWLFKMEKKSFINAALSEFDGITALNKCQAPWKKEKRAIPDRCLKGCCSLSHWQCCILIGWLAHGGGLSGASCWGHQEAVQTRHEDRNCLKCQDITIHLLCVLSQNIVLQKTQSQLPHANDLTKHIPEKYNSYANKSTIFLTRLRENIWQLKYYLKCCLEVEVRH